MAPWIIEKFPPHSVYVEPFGGAASVLLQKPPSRIEVYNDVDNGVVNLFRILRDPAKAEQLRRAIELTPFSRMEFYRCWDLAPECEIEEARRLIVRSFQSIGNKSRLAGNGWRTRTERARWSPCVAWNGWPDTVPDYVARLKDCIIECLPWQKMVDVYDGEDTLFYVDPPYPHSSRVAGYKKIYANELTDYDHEVLLDRLKQCRGYVILSSYPNESYDRQLEGWTKLEIRARAQTNSPRLEVLWLSPNVEVGKKQIQECLAI